MIDRDLLEQQLGQLPLYYYSFIDPASLDFSERIRYICSAECPMYGKTWACPPAVGEVSLCKAKCLSYNSCLMIGTITEAEDIADIDETLATRPAHEEITNLVGEMLRQQNTEPYILSTEACAICDRCAILDGQPCRHPEKMHPCVESQGINVVPVMESCGMEFQFGCNVVTWISLLLY